MLGIYYLFYKLIKIITHLLSQKVPSLSSLLWNLNVIYKEFTRVKLLQLVGHRWHLSSLQNVNAFATPVTKELFRNLNVPAIPKPLYCIYIYFSQGGITSKTSCEQWSWLNWQKIFGSAMLHKLKQILLILWHILK